MSRDGVALRVEKHTDAVIIKQNGFSQIINKRLETDRAYLVKIALHNIRISSYNVRQRTGKSRAARPRARPGCSAPVPLARPARPPGTQHDKQELLASCAGWNGGAELRTVRAEPHRRGRDHDRAMLSLTAVADSLLK